MITLRNIWTLIDPAQKREGIFLVLLLLLGAVFESIGLGMILPLIGLMTSPDVIMDHKYVAPIIARLGNPDSTTSFFIVLGLFNALFLVAVLYRIWLSWHQTAYLNKLKVDTSVSLFRAYMLQPWSFYQHRHSAELLNNVTKEVDLITQYGYAGVLNLTRELIFIAIVGLMLVCLAPGAAIIAILSLLPLAWLFQKLSRTRIRLWANKRQQLDVARVKSVQEGLSLIKEIKLAGREHQFVNRLDEYSDRVSYVERHQSFMRQLSRPVFELYAIISVSVSIVVMWYTGLSLMEIAPILGLFALTVLRFIPSINQILIALHGVRYVAPAVASVVADLSILQRVEASAQRSVAAPFTQAIYLNHVSYSYPQTDKKILADVTLEIPYGSFVGFIGTTGAGKSTLIDVVLGLLPPDAGAVLVDNQDIKSNLQGWQSQIGYVGQSIVMLDDTIRRNIALGLDDGDIDDNRIWQALESAQLSDVIKALPEQLDTEIGERGSRLSGGERQRLGIARALYHEPSVLVLDEATSALDANSESMIMSTIEALKGHCTILMITHRTETLAACDRVYRIQNGVVGLDAEQN